MVDMHELSGEVLITLGVYNIQQQSVEPIRQT